MTIDCILKLVSGEEIFSSIIKTEGDKITLSEPMKIFKKYKETEEGMSIMLNFESFMDYNNQLEHVIDRKHIITCEPLVPRLVTLYGEMKESTRSFVSGLPVNQGNITIH